MGIGFKSSFAVGAIKKEDTVLSLSIEYDIVDWLYRGEHWDKSNEECGIGNLVRVVILIMNLAEKVVVVLSTDNVGNDFRICVIWMHLRTTITYMSYLYKSYSNNFIKYNFLVSLADVLRNAVMICVIWMDLEQIIIYTTCLSKSK